MPENTILRDFLAQLRNYPLLSQPEEIVLFKQLHDESLSDDERAEVREELINDNLRLVVHFAKDYKNFTLTLMDLIQEGTLGLMQAVDRYDVTKINEVTKMPYRFSTFAVWWIKQSIAKAIADKGKSIRNPAHVQQQLQQYNRAVQRLTLKFNRTPTDEEVAIELNVDVAKISDYKKWRMVTTSLDAKLRRGPHGDDSDDTLADLVADMDSKTPIDCANDADLDAIIQAKLNRMEPRTEIIMRLRYHLGVPTRKAVWNLIKSKKWQLTERDFVSDDTAACLPLEVVGSKINLTRERVRQIEKETLAMLRNCGDLAVLAADR